MSQISLKGLRKPEKSRKDMKKLTEQNSIWSGPLQATLMLTTFICLMTLLNACTSTPSQSLDTLEGRVMTKQTCLAAALPVNPDLLEAPRAMPLYLLSERPLSLADQMTFQKWLLTEYGVNTRRLLLWQTHRLTVPERIDRRLMTTAELRESFNDGHK